MNEVDLPVNSCELALVDWTAEVSAQISHYPSTLSEPELHHRVLIRYRQTWFIPNSSGTVEIAIRAKPIISALTLVGIPVHETRSCYRRG